jgi:hypothetical protein
MEIVQCVKADTACKRFFASDDTLMVMLRGQFRRLILASGTQVILAFSRLFSLCKSLNARRDFLKDMVREAFEMNMVEPYVLHWENMKERSVGEHLMLARNYFTRYYRDRRRIQFHRADDSADLAVSVSPPGCINSEFRVIVGYYTDGGRPEYRSLIEILAEYQESGNLYNLLKIGIFSNHSNRMYFHELMDRYRDPLFRGELVTNARRLKTLVILAHCSYGVVDFDSLSELVDAQLLAGWPLVSGLNIGINLADLEIAEREAEEAESMGVPF